MTLLTPTIIDYIPSQKISVIKKPNDIQEYLDDGWEFNGRNNGYHVLSKPSEVRATL